MSPARFHGVVMISLLACLAFAVAAVGRAGGGDAARDAFTMDDETTGSVGSGKRASAQLALSDEQRGRIFEGVMRISDTPVVHEAAPAVAEAMPSGVRLEDLPAGVTREIPLVAGHKFVKFDDRIVVVEPASRVVVAMIPRYKLLP
jgi:hypothetical protein